MPDQSSPNAPESAHRNQPLRSLVAREPVGALIRRRRRALGLSQLQLARLLCTLTGSASMNQARISDYERGRHIPQRWLRPLSAALDIPLVELDEAALLSYILQRQHTIRRTTPFGPITRV